MPNQNGRNMNENRDRGEHRSWRHQDDDRSSRDRDDRMMHDNDDRTERFGGGQSGYGSGRFGDDRSMGSGYRNQGGRDHSHDDRQGVRTDDRFTGRGGEGYWEDRTERTGYNSGYNQGGMGFGQQGGGMPRDQGYRGGGGGAQMANEYNQHRYPDEYGPGDYGQRGHQRSGQQGGWGQGGNYQQQDFERGVGYGQHTGGRWANVPQSGMQGGHGGMQGNYGQGMQGGYASQSGYGQQQGGGFRGKGPQGYMRSDDRIKEIVCEALQDDDHVDASHIEIVVKNGEVILTGTVDDRRQKRLAEDCIERLPGVKDVQNQLRVGSASRGNQSSGSAVGRNETETSDKKHRA